MPDLETLDDAVAAEAFRRLVRHLRHRSDVAKIDLLGPAGYSRTCLAAWPQEAGYGISREAAREIVYGMPAAEWRAKHPDTASEQQIARMKASVAKNEALDEALDESFPASDPPSMTDPGRG